MNKYILYLASHTKLPLLIVYKVKHGDITNAQKHTQRSLCIKCDVSLSVTLFSFSILCMWRVHDAVVAEKYLLSVEVQLWR